MPYRESTTTPSIDPATAITCRPRRPDLPTVVLEAGVCHLVVSMGGWGSSLVEQLAVGDQTNWEASTAKGPLSRRAVAGYRAWFSITRSDQLRLWLAKRFPHTRRILRALRTRKPVCALYQPFIAVPAADRDRIRDGIRQAVARGTIVVVYADWRELVEVADVCHVLPTSAPYRRGTVDEMFRPDIDGPSALDATYNSVHGKTVQRFGDVSYTFPERWTTIHGTKIGPNGREGFTEKQLLVSFHVPARAVTVDPDVTREGYAVMTGTVHGRYRVGAHLRLHIQTAETWLFQADVAPDRQVAVGDTITFGFDTKHIRT